MPTKAFLGLGSNIEPRQQHIERAIGWLARIPGVSLGKVSSLYETEPVGGPQQGAFLNNVVEIKTQLPPQTLLSSLLQIEKDLGRVRRKKWGPRKIDIDILTYGSKKLRSHGLQIPHPRYTERRFVLIPMAEIVPRHAGPLLRRLTPQGQRVTIVGRWKRSHFVLSKKKRNTKPR